ncbi:MAG: phosphodiester glycosidase family protein [Acidimicrobiales bacterium]
MATKANRPRWRKIVKRILIGVSIIVLFVGSIAAWAVNRYIIDHVEIANVAAYEASVSASTSTIAGAATTAAPTGPALVTDTSYTYGATTISIRKVVIGTGNATVTYFVADVALGEGAQLRSAFAENKFGTNIIADTSTIAEENNAIFAINGDYYGFRTSGIVIRNGVIFRDKGTRQGLAIYRDGTMALYDETTTTAQELVDAGVWNTLSFGPGLLADGQIPDGIDKVQIDTNIGNHSIQGNQPRTGLGMITTNHFVFIAVDGRSTGYSRGVTMIEFAQMFKDLGATVAYNLDGGGSTTMYFNGEVVNNPQGKNDERGTSDILYIASSSTASES